MLNDYVNSMSKQSLYILNYNFISNKIKIKNIVRLIFEGTNKNSIRTSRLNFIQANLPNKGFEYVVLKAPLHAENSLAIYIVSGGAGWSVNQTADSTKNS